MTQDVHARVAVEEASTLGWPSMLVFMARSLACTRSEHLRRFKWCSSTSSLQPSMSSPRPKNRSPVRRTVSTIELFP